MQKVHGGGNESRRTDMDLASEIGNRNVEDVEDVEGISKSAPDAERAGEWYGTLHPRAL